MSDNRPAPIQVRPRNGSMLERIHEEQKLKGQGMADLIHSWAEAHQNKAEEK